MVGQKWDNKKTELQNLMFNKIDEIKQYVYYIKHKVKVPKK